MFRSFSDHMFRPFKLDFFIYCFLSYTVNDLPWSARSFDTLLVILNSFCFASSLRSSVLESHQVFSCLFVLTSNTTFITYYIHASNFLMFDLLVIILSLDQHCNFNHDKCWCFWYDRGKCPLLFPICLGYSSLLFYMNFRSWRKISYIELVIELVVWA